MSQTAARAAHEAPEIPAAGTWEIDRSHSAVSFTVRHLMVARVRGRFDDFAGTVRVGETPEGSSVDVTIQAASIDSGEPQRDAHLRSPDFLDVENHPALTFRSTGFRQTGATTFELPGDLTIRGVTRPVVLAATYEGLTPDPWGNTRIAFSAETEINREDWGLTWNQALETGGVLVGKQVKIQIEVTAVRTP